MSPPEIIACLRGQVGHLTLNRPAALNALTRGMISELTLALQGWRTDPSVRLIVIDAAGPKAFCAGGDISAIYAQGRSGAYQEIETFWREEYRLNDLIANYPKPVVSFIHGFCLGGGVGIACHASHRVVGETAQLAMPECGIGFIPDVGGTWLLSCAPEGIGTWLALTGARAAAADAITAGFADLHIPEARWPEVKSSLEATGDISLLTQFAVALPANAHSLFDANLCSIFAQDDLVALVQMLGSEGTPAATRALDAIRAASPLALATAFEALRRMKQGGDLRDALRLEYRAGCRFLRAGDFLEGIRARLIERGSVPKWRHSCVEDVETELAAAMLAPLEATDLTF
ncbi:enoyl-CoA hydratase/isomerase family protein [Pseudotabrizicola sp. 4114]|uniref:enoyl-CoA hydratase/isomerase family protein n=1 Tax=Pseudotabrizicola sp. 4114 TaxID=2817731 RepID=UPI0028678596|nr:enoyl-CoA hydratase/carnithine racemase [Pseudorhodobacter sp. 4114]